MYSYASSNQELFKWDEETTTVTSDLPKAKNDFDSFIERIMKTTRCKDVLCALSCEDSADNFRYGVLPSYKHNRKDTVRPVLRKELNAYVEATYSVKRKPCIEGDDVLGILATAYPGKYLIATIDKDLRQIPGSHYNWGGDGFFKVTPAEGDLWFYTQILTGDTTDGYKGCPGIGKVKAEAILQAVLDECTPWATREQLNAHRWTAIVAAYEKKKLTEADALVQARCARILQNTDYNFKTDEVILWKP